MTQVVDRLIDEVALHTFDRHAGILKKLEKIFNMQEVFLRRLREDNDVIYADEGVLQHHRRRDHVHFSLKRQVGVPLTEWHLRIAKKTVTCHESCLVDTFSVHHNLPIAGVCIESQENLRLTQ